MTRRVREPLARERPSRPGGGARAAVIDARQDDMRGPKLMALAVVAFFGSSLLAVHLMSLPGAPAAMPAPSVSRATPSAPAPPVARAPAPVAPAVVPAPTPASLAATEPPPDVVEEGLPPSLNLGVAPVPPVAPSIERERKVIACVERRFREGGESVEQTLPGRWPALKRAREEKRLRRLALRAACEKDLGS